ncbi:TPA: UvrY/SirA/GacA family response regulator transcription factor [Escherichia coli]|nr:UvrY/SirA/GacA family response regulator transcription factor [Escherichia coli]
MQDTDFFSWLRTMLLRFQRMEAAEEVYHEIELQAQQLEYDYYSLCVRHPVPFTRPKVAFYTNYPESWVSYYQAKNFLAIDPVLNPENFSQGHLMWNDDLFSEAQPLWEAARAHGLRRGVTQYLMLPNRALGFLSFLLVDDHELVRAGIRRILEDIKGIKVVGEASCGEDAVKWCRANAVDVVLMDMSMPGIGGLEATRKIARSTADVKIIMLTVHTENPLPAKVMQAGAAGYLSKGAAPQEVVSAIRSVYSGQRYIASDIAQQMALSQIEPEKTESPFASLSERELQIMLMITKGQKVNEISEQLNLSPKTVNSYRYRMFSKLNIHGDVELTHLAIRHGLCNAETLSSQ